MNKNKLETSTGELFESLEKREQARFKSTVVYRIRHGKTEYHEHLHQYDKMADGLDITKEGEQMMVDNAGKIMKREEMHKEDTIFCVVASPRIRAQNGKKIIEDELKKNGFSVWDDPRMDRPQNLVRNFDFFDNDGEQVHVEDEKHPEYFQKAFDYLANEIPEGLTAEQHALHHNLPNVETYGSAGARARRQLSKFVRVARKIQPNIERRVVIIQIEHKETLSDFFDQASAGDYSMEKSKGPKKGEMVRLEIPTDSNSNELEVDFLDEDRDNKVRKIKYDHIKKEFMQN
jgi:broad specificity phosphatase PhoE